MIISRRRFAENGKDMHRNKKKHTKGVQSFCFWLLNMQNFWRFRCHRVVDLKLSNDQKDGQAWTCNFEQRFRHRRVVDLKLPKYSIIRGREFQISKQVL